MTNSAVNLFKFFGVVKGGFKSGTIFIDNSTDQLVSVGAHKLDYISLEHL